MSIVVAAAFGIVAVVVVAVASTREQEAPLVMEPPNPPEVDRLLALASDEIRVKYNYTAALMYTKKAHGVAPKSSAVQKFHASVLLALGHVSEAWAHLRSVFESRTASAQDPHFLQQYVLSLHRLGHKEELELSWPRISRTPGVHWRTPLQCPDLVDPDLLKGAKPFPDMTSLRVPRVLVESKDIILEEFQSFLQRSDWNSSVHFKPNQDNDLVQGNAPQLWTEMLLFNKGSWEGEACRLLPRTCKKLRGMLEIEGIAHGKRSGQVSLLSLSPGAKLVPHFGSVNWRYTAHLGLLVPEGVTMFAGDEKRSFVQGEVLLLDDSFLHSVEHLGNGPRVTLFANFFHPDVKVVSYDEWLEQR